MSNLLLSSKIAIIEEQPTVRPIQGATLSDTAMEAITERGPVGGKPTLVQGAGQFTKIFGGFTANSEGALAAQMFFDNGGINLWVSRTVHYTDPTNPNTKTSASASVTLLTAVLLAGPAVLRPASGTAPYNLSPGDTVLVKLNGGGPVTATFNATAASVASTNAEPFVLVDGMTLNVAFDGGPVVAVVFHTASFSAIGAALATEVIAVINAAIAAAGASGVATADGGHHVVLTTTQLGSGASLQILAGTSNTALGFTPATTNGTGNVANIANVTATEVETVLVAAIGGAVTGSVVGGLPSVQTVATGPAVSLQVSSGTARTKIGYDLLLHSGTQAGALPTLLVTAKTDGAYGNVVQPEIAAPTNGTAGYFNVIVLKAGAVVEVWPNVNMIAESDPRYIETILNDPNNGSDYITVTDQDAAVASPSNIPAQGTFSMTGGSDGLTGLVDADFLGNAAGPTGLRCFDTTLGLRLLIVPGQATPAVHNGMLTYCEATRFGSMFAILDPPAATSAAGMVTYMESTALLTQASEYGAMFWPNVQIANPQTSVFGSAAAITVPPSGAIAGLCGRNDAAQPGGVYEAPAGVDFGRLLNVTGLETDEVKDENKRDLVAPALVNPIVGLEGLPIHVDGDQTLKSNGNFPTIGERRGVIYIEQSLKQGLAPFKHRKIKPSQLAALNRSITAFLLLQMKNDAFATDDPKTAFSVDTSGGINTPADAFARTENAGIGIATAKPADFIVLRVGQDTRALEAQLAAAAA